MAARRRTQALALQKEGKLPAARQELEAALKSARDLRLVPLEARLLNDLGNLCYEEGAIEKARDSYRESAEVAQSLGQPPAQTDQWELLPDALDNLGYAEFDLGRYKESEAANIRAIDWLGERLRAKPDAAMELKQARIRVDLVRSYNARALFKATREQIELALPVFRKGTDGRYIFGQDICLSTLATAYQGLGKYEKAIALNKRALPLLEQVSPGTATGVYNNLGDVYARLAADARQEGAGASADKWSAEAERALQTAVARYRGAKAKRETATALANLGNVYFHLRDYGKSLDAYKEARRLSVESGAQPPDLVQMDFNIGAVMEQEGRLEAARAAFQAAARSLETADARLDAAWAYYSLGGVLERMDRLEEALAAFERCRLLGEAVGDQADDPSEFGRFQSANLGDTYSRGARILLELGRDEKALEYAERGRAWGLSMQAARNDVHIVRDEH